MPRFLFASFQVPGIGGSSTAAFDLFARMSREGRDVHYLNLIAEDPAYIAATFGAAAGNPLGMPGVLDYWIEGAESERQDELARMVQDVRPDVVLGFGFPAALLIRRNVPDARTVLMTGSCRQAAAYVTTGRASSALDLARRLKSARRPPRILAHGERIAVERCDLVITHSQSTLDFMTVFFPASIQRIYPRPISYAEWIADAVLPWKHLARPFESRDIDALFVANNWDRAEKNFPLVQRLAARLPGLRIHVAGDAPRALKGVAHHGFVAGRGELFELLGRSKCVVSPSLIDAAPGVLFEAAAMGCNVVASANCGNADICHPMLVPESLEPRAFAECVERGVRMKYEDNLGAYLSRGSYADLTATLDAFANPFQSRGAA